MIGKLPIPAILLLCVVGIAACAPSHNVATRAVAPEMSPADDSRVGIVLLGTGTPNADPERMGPSLAVIVNGKAYIVDCGAGIGSLPIMPDELLQEGVAGFGATIASVE